MNMCLLILVFVNGHNRLYLHQKGVEFWRMKEDMFEIALGTRTLLHACVDLGFVPQSIADVSLIRIRQQDARLQPPHSVAHPGEAQATPRVEPRGRQSCPPGPDILCLSLVTCGSRGDIGDKLVSHSLPLSPYYCVCRVYLSLVAVVSQSQLLFLSPCLPGTLCHSHSHCLIPDHIVPLCLSLAPY